MFLLDVCWHYLLCVILFAACLIFVQKGKKKTALLLTGAMLVISAVGFYLVYMGPFRESGKTFLGYVTRYGVVSLSIFLFPVLGLLAYIQKSK